MKGSERAAPGLSCSRCSSRMDLRNAETPSLACSLGHNSATKKALRTGLDTNSCNPDIPAASCSLRTNTSLSRLPLVPVCGISCSKNRWISFKCYWYCTKTAIPHLCTSAKAQCIPRLHNAFTPIQLCTHGALQASVNRRTVKLSST